MINYDLYVNIIDYNKILNHTINICAICIVINLIISVIHSFADQENNSSDKKEKTNQKNLTIIDYLGAICIILFLLLIIPFYQIIGKIIPILYIPSLILILYVIYIRPMTTSKPSPFIFDYYEYGAMVTLALIYFTKIKYKEIFINISNESSLQIICIFILLLEVFSNLYCLLLNIYFVIKNLRKIKIDILFNKYEDITENIYSKIDYSNIYVYFSNTNNLIFNHNTKAKKVFLFLPYFVFDLIKSIVTYTLSLIVSFVIKPILTIISFLFYKIIKISETNENQINSGLSRIVWTLSILFVYIVLQANDIFKPKIINVYEFISSVIIIPIILEALISLKGKINNSKKVIGL